MALITTKPGGAGVWFKADEYANAKAILIETKRVERDVPNVKFGGTRNIATADLTIFNTIEELEGTNDPLVLTGAKVTGAALAGDLEDLIGDAAVFCLEKLPPQNGKNGYWVWREVDVAIAEYVSKYYDKRESDLDEIEMPKF